MYVCVCVVIGNTTRLSLQVSGDGMRVLLVAITGQVFLWECMDVRDLTGLRDGIVKGQWAHIQPLEDTILPSSQDKEASQHTIFVKTEVCTYIIREGLHVWCMFVLFIFSITLSVCTLP